MGELEYTPEFKKMFEEFDKAGGCLEIRVFKFDNSIAIENKQMHFRVATHTIYNELLNEENEEHFLESGKKITLNEFYGNLINIKEEEVILEGKKTNYNNFYIHNTNKKVLIRYLDGGLGYAFFQTPHGLSLKSTIKDEGDFFFSFFKELLGDLSFIEVYKWSTDFSKYFDEGKEWWGEFYWTVYSFEKDIFIGIVASTTD